MRGIRSFSHAVLFVAVEVDYPVGGAAVGPDQEQDVFAGGDSMDFTDELIRAFDWVAVDFEDDVAGGETGVIGWAGGTNALDGCSVDLRGEIQLRADVGCEVGDG